MRFKIMMTIGATIVTFVFLSIATWLGRDTFFEADEEEEEENEI